MLYPVSHALDTTQELLGGHRASQNLSFCSSCSVFLFCLLGETKQLHSSPQRQLNTLFPFSCFSCNRHSRPVTILVFSPWCTKWLRFSSTRETRGSKWSLIHTLKYCVTLTCWDPGPYSVQNYINTCIVCCHNPGLSQRFKAEVSNCLLTHN